MSENIVVEEAPLEGDPITDFQEEAPQETQTEETQQPEFIIPEKYAGKSNEDLVEMHQNVEKMMSKQSNEVGEQRKLIQSLVDAQTRATETAPPKEEEANFEDQFYSDPKQALNNAIENHPELLAAKEERKISAQKQQVSVLEKAYPDWQAKIATSEFQKWVGESEIRTEMFQKADSEYRPDYAIELFDMFDKVNMIDKTKEVQEAEIQKRDKALKATTTENRSTSDTLGGKKVYRRADLIQLQVSDPNRYEALQDEIYSAYQEGRVK